MEVYIKAGKNGSYLHVKDVFGILGINSLLISLLCSLGSHTVFFSFLRIQQLQPQHSAKAIN